MNTSKPPALSPSLLNPTLCQCRWSIGNRAIAHVWHMRRRTTNVARKFWQTIEMERLKDLQFLKTPFLQVDGKLFAVVRQGWMTPKGNKRCMCLGQTLKKGKNMQGNFHRPHWLREKGIEA